LQVVPTGLDPNTKTCQAIFNSGGDSDFICNRAAICCEGLKLCMQDDMLQAKVMLYKIGLVITFQQFCDCQWNFGELTFLH
jgi:hypothetical protein